MELFDDTARREAGKIARRPGVRPGELLESQEKTDFDQFLTSMVPGHEIKRF